MARPTAFDALAELRKPTAADTYTGATPADWNWRATADGSGPLYFLRITVRPTSCDAWRQFERLDELDSPRAVAERKVEAKRIAGAASAYTETLAERILREEQLKRPLDHVTEKLAAGVRDHLLVSVEICTAPDGAEPLTWLDESEALKEALDAGDEAAAERALAGLRERLSIEKVLADRESATAETVEDFDWLFGELRKKETPSGLFFSENEGRPASMLHSFAMVCLRLAALATQAQRFERDQEVERGKKPPTFGPPSEPETAAETSAPSSATSAATGATSAATDGKATDAAPARSAPTAARRKRRRSTSAAA